MDYELLERLFTQHGMSGGILACMGWFIIKKLPGLIEGHLSSLDRHFKQMESSFETINERADQRHRELIDYMEKKK